METYTGGVTNYHAANACGPNMKNGFASYEERFRCKTNDPLNLEKLNKAKRCIEGRIHAMGKKSITQYNSTSADSEKSNYSHIHPIKYAYGYAKECIGKLNGDPIKFEDNTLELLHQHGINHLDSEIRQHRHLTESELVSVKSKCPTIFCLADENHIKTLVPLATEEFFNHLGQIPMLIESDKISLKNALNETKRKITEHLRLNKESLYKETLMIVRQQIDILLSYLSRFSLRNLSHESNYKMFKGYQRNNTTKKSRNFKTEYYKKLGNRYNKTMKTLSSKISLV